MRSTGGQNKHLAVVRAALGVLILAVLTGIVLLVSSLIKTDWRYRRIAENTALSEDLFNGNPEVAAYLEVYGTQIRTPVTQAEDNLKYIDKDVNGELSFAGNPFLDYRNAAEFSDSYILIYGHHMENHLMFGDLSLFEDPAFWSEDRRGRLLLRDGRELGIRFFACLRADSEDSRYFDPVRVKNNWNEEFLTGLLAEAEIVKEEITTEDQILVLSTCVTAASEDRILLFGKLGDV